MYSDNPLENTIDLEEVRKMLSHFHYRDFQEAQELILSALQEINEHFGWVSLEAAEVVAEHFGTTASRVYGLLTFYADFRPSRGASTSCSCVMAWPATSWARSAWSQNLEDVWGIADGGHDRGRRADRPGGERLPRRLRSSADLQARRRLLRRPHPETLNEAIRGAIAGRRQLAGRASSGTHTGAT